MTAIYGPLTEIRGSKEVALLNRETLGEEFEDSPIRINRLHLRLEASSERCLRVVLWGVTLAVYVGEYNPPYSTPAFMVKASAFSGRGPCKSLTMPKALVVSGLAARPNEELSIVALCHFPSLPGSVNVAVGVEAPGGVHLDDRFAKSLLERARQGKAQVGVADEDN